VVAAKVLRKNCSGRLYVGTRYEPGIIGVALAMRDAHELKTRLYRLATSAQAWFRRCSDPQAVISPPAGRGFKGSDAALEGVAKAEVEAAKSFFLRFSGETVLEETRHGQVLRLESNRPARIFANGRLAAEEQRFAFSYDITSLTATMRRALNGERTNVGRGEYSDGVRIMLLGSTCETLGARHRCLPGCRGTRPSCQAALHRCQVLRQNGMCHVGQDSRLVQNRELPYDPLARLCCYEGQGRACALRI
jgi:hypothetical protein